MGRIQIPLAFLTEDTTACWYPLGRSSAKDNICGEVFLELTLKASQVWINILWVVMDTVTLNEIDADKDNDNGWSVDNVWLRWPFVWTKFRFVVILTRDC